MNVVVAQTRDEVAAIVERCSKLERIAVDVEGDGLFAFRAKLCTVQLFADGEAFVVDTLATPAGDLAPLLGDRGPIKILHDLTFDAKLLHDAGAPLARARDTSVAARLLGRAKTGLASLVEAELGGSIDKRFQHHDWRVRPLRPEHVAYLAGDVAHLEALFDKLAREASARGIEAEIEEETAHKLATALDPPRDPRPSWARIAAKQKLDAPSLAVLRELALARDRIAERRDVPPFKVASSDELLAVARAKPRDANGLAQAKGPRRDAAVWLAAVARGVEAGDVPDDDRAFLARAPFDRADAARRTSIERRLAAFRKREAEARGVDEQVVLPGHIASDLADRIAARGELDEEALLATLGPSRRARYAELVLALAREARASS